MEPEDYDRLLAELASSVHSEVVTLETAAGRRCAHDVSARQPVPRFPTSAMDGFALDATALRAAQAGEDVRVGGDVPAGHPAPGLVPGSALRVMTGAHVPDGAEVVIPVEFTDADPTGEPPATIRVSDLPETAGHGWNIRAIGEDTNVGDLILGAGDRITDAGVGTLAMLGISALDVIRPLEVGLIVTGDELRPEQFVTADEQAENPAALIHNSNLPMLATAVRESGGIAHPRVCDDDPERFSRLLEELAGQVDLIITTGGISQGAYEVVRTALEGSHSTFGRVAMRPGGPQGHGRFHGTPLLHFPGTPAAAYLSFHLFARTFFDGRALAERWRKAVFTGADLIGHRRGVSLLPGRYTSTGEIEAAEWARLRDFARAEAIIRVPAAPGRVQAGDVIEVLHS
ncbi:molybdopterin molybdotransferase MoeA [Brevibacterium sp.]|uniref:molybdopterin molybdotransferase MoeA n=1 Tax=Brevibacterium sp. TaxID=1701 RepID=UPI0028119CE3|nr:molybdopterin molybdotransferase MoeA [Brevibacterium sp.]